MTFWRHPLTRSGGFVAVLAAVQLVAPASHADTLQVTNPLIQQRADPDIFKHTDGNYYFTATIPSYDKIELRRAATIQGLATAAATVIWSKHASGIMGAHIWAPELHYINSRWYIYFAAGGSSDTWAIHIYVLENTSANPLQGSWTEKGEVVTSWESMALDATTFEFNGTWYLVWAQNDPSLAKNSSLFIAPMSNPWTLASPGVRISRPELSWEIVGAVVDEGPAVLVKNGKVFIAFSASATDANYCIGLLTASATSDLLNASSWSKSPAPVFKSGNGVYGPGHNQFTTSPDGTVDLLVYHGRDYAAIPAQYGSSLNDPNRHTRVQQLNWNSDGTPNFGTPVANGTITLGTGGTSGGGGGASGRGGAGGATGSGGAPGTGGSANSGGTPATGGGVSSTGGKTGLGGVGGTGGLPGSGGVITSGGSGASGGAASTGGAAIGGRATGDAGATGGGVSTSGGSASGGASTAGAIASGGRTIGTGGTAMATLPQGSGGTSGEAGSSGSVAGPDAQASSGCACNLAGRASKSKAWTSLVLLVCVLARGRRRDRSSRPMAG